MELLSALNEFPGGGMVGTRKPVYKLVELAME